MTALPHAVAARLAEACRAAALDLGVPMAVAIVDAEGGLLSFSRMDGTLPVSTELAASKAFTAAVLRLPSDVVGKLAQPGAALYGIQNSHAGRIVLFGGGIPLLIDGAVVGAVGVSGGSVEEDMRIAGAAVDLLGAMAAWAGRIGRLSGAPVLAAERGAEALEAELAGADPDAARALAGGLALAVG